jgi:hypothetical protein
MLGGGLGKKQTILIVLNPMDGPHLKKHIYLPLGFRLIFGTSHPVVKKDGLPLTNSGAD